MLYSDLEELSFRKDVPDWDEYFMGFALYAATRSKDPKTQVGACIVDEKNRILSLGYNGMPSGIKDDEKHWSQKHLYVSHAEANAIDFYRNNLEGSTLYVTFLPCNECAKRIIQNKIRRVVYFKKKISKHIPADISIQMFEEAGVEVVKYQPKNKIILLRI